MPDLLDFLSHPEFAQKTPDEQKATRQRFWDLAQTKPEFAQKSPEEQANLRALILGTPILKERPDVPLRVPGAFPSLFQKGPVHQALNPMGGLIQATEPVSAKIGGKIVGEMRPGGMLSAPNVGSIGGGLAGMTAIAPYAPALLAAGPWGPVVALALAGIGGAGLGSMTGRGGEILNRRLFGAPSEPEPRTQPTSPPVNPRWQEELASMGQAANVGMMQEAIGQGAGLVLNKALHSGLPPLNRWWREQAPWREAATRHGITEQSLPLQTGSPVLGQISVTERYVPIGTGASRRSIQELREKVVNSIANKAQAAAGGPVFSKEAAGRELQETVARQGERLQQAMQRQVPVTPPLRQIGQEVQEQIAAIRGQAQQQAADFAESISPGIQGRTLSERGTAARMARKTLERAASKKYGKPFKDIGAELKDAIIPVPTTLGAQADIRDVGAAAAGFQTAPERKLAGAVLQEAEERAAPVGFAMGAKPKPGSVGAGLKLKDWQALLESGAIQPEDIPRTFRSALQSETGGRDGLTWKQYREIDVTLRELADQFAERDPRVSRAAYAVRNALEQDVDEFFAATNPQLQTRYAKAKTDWKTHVIEPFRIYQRTPGSGEIINPVNQTLAFEPEAGNIINRLFATKGPTGIITADRVQMMKKALGPQGFQDAAAGFHDDLVRRQALDDVTQAFSEEKYLTLTGPKRMPEETLKELFTPDQLTQFYKNREAALAIVQNRTIQALKDTEPSQVVARLIDTSAPPEALIAAKQTVGPRQFERMAAARLNQVISESQRLADRKGALKPIIDWLDSFSPEQYRELFSGPMGSRIQAVRTAYVKAFDSFVRAAIQKGNPSELLDDLFAKGISVEEARMFRRIAGNKSGQYWGSYLDHLARQHALDETGKFSLSKFLNRIAPEKVSDDALTALTGNPGWTKDFAEFRDVVLQRINEYGELTPFDPLYIRLAGAGQLSALGYGIMKLAGSTIVGATGIPWLISQAMHTPGGIRLLTQGLKTTAASKAGEEWITRFASRFFPVPATAEQGRLAQTKQEREQKVPVALKPLATTSPTLPPVPQAVNPEEEAARQLREWGLQ